MTKSIRNNNKPRILVVDDSDFIRWGLKAELDAAGYDVVEASSGSEALEKIVKVERLSMITMGLQMQGMTGFDVLEKFRSDEMQNDLIRAGNIDVPVIFITSNDNEDDRMRGFALGAVNFVLKKNVRGNLIRIIGELLKPNEELNDVHIIVADDSAVTRAVVSACLKELGVHIHEADDGRSALDILKSTDYTIDLVLTDLHMRDMNGDTLCQHIRANSRYRNVPVIFLSGKSRRPVIDLFKMGATDYLRKPFIKEELKARIGAHLRRQQLNRTLQQKVEELNGANALKDKFLSMCSHDLRTPISGMLGYCSILKETALLDDQREMVDNMVEAGNNLLSLINDLLELGRVQQKTELQNIATLDLVDVLRKSIDMLQHMATKKQLVLRLDADSEKHFVKGCRNSLLRVFNNLLSNAIKFSHHGDEVVIRVAINDSLRLINVDVVDKGLGIPAKLQDRVFDKYTKTSRSGTDGEAGTGLGMAITLELLNAHCGTISLSSVEGEGTTVHVELPLVVKAVSPVSGAVAEQAQQKETEPTALKSEAPSVSKNNNFEPLGLRVLVAEDNAVISMILSKLLRSMGCNAELSSDGHQACELYKKCFDNAPFDVVLMDLEMPIMDGMTSVGEIREFEADLLCTSGAETFKPVPIYALTAHVDEGIADQCKNNGMNGYLRKPLDQAELYDVLKAYRTD